MSLNSDKTVCVAISDKEKPLQFSYTLEGTPLARVECYKYLGVAINKNMSRDSHIQILIIKKITVNSGFLGET